jgi:predicted transcriptional regulator of viral defense system
MKKFLILYKDKNSIYSTNDLSNLWLEKNKNTLYTTIKRYIKENKLFRIQKGLYSKIPISQLDKNELARKLLSGYCYLSLETVLFNHGFRSQVPKHLTFVGEEAKTIKLDNLSIKCQQLNIKFLYNETETYLQNEIRVATAERAVCDTLYYNSLADFDKKIDWKAINILQRKIGYKVTNRK